MPPTVTKMAALPKNGQPPPQRQVGSLLAQAVPVQSLVRRNVNIVIYGMNGCGKTTLAAEFPRPLLLVSFEPGETGGAISVCKTEGITFLRIETKAQAVQLARELESDTYFRTHVLDTCTSLQNNVLMRGLMNLDSAPVQLNWGSVPQEVYRERSEQAKEVMQLYRDLPVNTVFLAQEKDFNKGEDDRKRLQVQNRLNVGAFFAASLGKGTVEWMHDACDFVCHLEMVPETREVVTELQLRPEDPVTRDVQLVETGRMVRRIQCIYDGRCFARMRSPSPGCVPDYIETTNSDDGPRKMYDDVTRVINGEKALKGYYPKER